MSERAAALLAFLLAFFLTSAAAAHEVGLSRGEYALAGDTVTVTITFARREMIGLVAGLDADHNGALTQAEVDASRDAITGAFVGRVKVRGDGAACPGELASAALADEDGLTVRARYGCPSSPREASVELALLEDLPFGHRHVARSSGGGSPSDAILSQRSRTISIVAAVVAQGAAKPAQPRGGERSLSSLYALGLTRALTSPDAIFFLLALILFGGRIRALVRVLVAFALTSSIGIFLAALGLFAPSPSVLGPALALSVVYAGADNFSSPRAEDRFRVALPFGLVHGFAFGSVIVKDLPPPRGLDVALLDLGVVSGEALALALLLLFVQIVCRRASLQARGARLVSAAIVVVGLVLLARRVL